LVRGYRRLVKNIPTHKVALPKQAELIAWLILTVERLFGLIAGVNRQQDLPRCSHGFVCRQLLKLMTPPLMSRCMIIGLDARRAQ